MNFFHGDRRTMLEIIATTIEDAKRIDASGAGRIELIRDLSQRGLTPSHRLWKYPGQSDNKKRHDGKCGEDPRLGRRRANL